MARKSRDGERAAFENVTIRTTPAHRAALDVLSRVKHQSFSAILQEVLDRRLIEASRELMGSNSEHVRAAGDVIALNLRRPNDAPHERIILLYELAPEFVSFNEAQVIRVLQQLGAFPKEKTLYRRDWEEEPEHVTSHFEYDNLLIASIWSDVYELVQSQLLDVVAISSVITEAKEKITAARATLAPSDT